MNRNIVLEISVDDQRLNLLADGRVQATYPVSTAAKGIGFTSGSLRTPVGRFRVLDKHGAEAPWGTVFRSLEPVGVWSAEMLTMEDLVLSRVIRLEGLDPDNGNTLARCIYIHGTNREDLIGSPASHGCIRLRNSDMIELFEQVPVDARVVIHPPQHRRGKLLFLDCDSTLSEIEGIDELARECGAGVYAEVVALTHAAMNGEVPLDDVFRRRMEIIRPDAAACARVSERYVATLVPGVREMVVAARAAGWNPIVLSGGFAPLIEPMARVLDIEHVEAVPLYHDEHGAYAGYGMDYPTTRNGGKNEVIREWKQALLPERVAMVGDGVSDLETKSEVDVFIGFGGVVSREKVRAGTDHWCTSMTDILSLLDMLDAE